MRIVHICLSNYYIDNRAYQENELVKEHVRLGHEVFVIASTHVHDSDGKRAFTSPGSYRTPEGAKVTRLPYHPVFPLWAAKSLRVHRNVYMILKEIMPNVIMFHGICGWELLNVARYKKHHPDVRLYADTHTDFINSARSVISKWILHYCYYRTIVRKVLPFLDKIFCISEMTKDFATKFYNIPESKVEFYPLGGHPIPIDEYQVRRNNTRSKLGIDDRTILFVQSGKQSASKKLSQTLRAFSKVDEHLFRLIIVGLLMDDVRDEALQRINKDKRINYVGWRSPEDLEDILCAADVYLQPGSQSSTLQTSICCYCATVISDLPGHDMYADGNGWLVDTEEDMVRVFEEIKASYGDLDMKKNVSREKAIQYLDYAILAERILR